MPTYSSFVFSDKEKNDIRKLHESYRMSYGKLIKEQPKEDLPADATTDKPTEQEQRPLTGPESLETDLISGPIKAEVAVRLGKLYIFPQTGNEEKDKFSYVGNLKA